MGQKDLTEKSLEFYPDVFADVANALMYEGGPVVLAEELQPAPTETLYPGGNGELRNQFHDVSKYVMCAGHIKMQYTIENETKARRKTVLRKAGYEGAVYREQVDKEDCYPVVSILLNWGKGKWRHPRRLSQLWQSEQLPEEIRDYIDDVKLHVYDMYHLPQKIRSRFKSDMRIIVDYLAEGRDYVPTQQRIVHVEALMRMLETLTGDARYETMIQEMLETEEEKGDVTMCELLDKYENRGINKGKIEGRLDDIRNLMETMQWTAEQAMSALKISEDDKAKYIMKL